MSLDHSPTRDGGGWSSPGLTTPYDEGSARSRGGSPGKKAYGDLMNGNSSHVTWAQAKAGSARVQRSNEGSFMRHMRKMSSGLPYFSDRSSYAEKEKLGRGRPWERVEWKDLPRRIGLLISRRRKYVALLVMMLLMILLFTNKTVNYWYRRTSWLGGGSKFVIILGANQGGGVMDWKGPREWAIERDSVKNKKKYAAEWGYEMEIADMSTKKRYAHEWRESWEKVDVIRNAMRKYPDAEWFWWLDLNTFIMERTYSLQSHIFNNLAESAYRDINYNNPLHIAHPPNGTSADVNAPKYVNYLDPEALSATGDGDPNSVNILIPQDCGGFNLGSFFMRRSLWTDRLMDIWWDPVFYEQRHMEWEHKEQDALEYIYTNQPWIRPHFAFLPQRTINAFPDKACGDDRHVPEGGCKVLKPGDPVDKTECGIQGIHYQEKERDFLVNMAGCEWGRDCWGEMYNFRQLSNHLNRGRWEKFADSTRDYFKRRKEAKQAKQPQQQQ